MNDCIMQETTFEINVDAARDGQMLLGSRGAPLAPHRRERTSAARLLRCNWSASSKRGGARVQTAATRTRSPAKTKLLRGAAVTGAARVARVAQHARHAIHARHSPFHDA